MSKKSVLDVDEVKRLYDSGLTQTEVGKKFGVGKRAVYEFMKINKIQVRQQKEAHIKLILTNDQINEIHKLYDSGLKNRTSIALKLEIGEHYVRQALKEKINNKNYNSELNYLQKQLIFGSLLGDSCIRHRDTVRKIYDKNTNNIRERVRDSYDFSVGHCLAQKEYLEHKAFILGSKVFGRIKDVDSFSAGKLFYSTYYHNKKELGKIFSIVAINNKKSPNKVWMDNLDAIGIAYWFMDDGSSSFAKGRCGRKLDVEFATQSFSIFEVNILRNKLLDFGIETTIKKCKYYNSDKTESHILYGIRVKQNSINKLMDLIEPTVKKIPCMVYKIKRKLIK